MVIGVHCIDPFYISPTMRVIPEYTHWAAIYGSLFRSSVPLFVMMTGLLLLPIKQNSLNVFYKKRIYRVLFPFIIWSVLYNMFPWFTGILGLPKSIIGDFFCYTQGHEIRTPLSLIKLPLEKLQEKEWEGKESKYISVMDENVNYLLNVTNQLLDFQKMESRELQLAAKRYNVNQLVRHDDAGIIAGSSRATITASS